MLYILNYNLIFFYLDAKLRQITENQATYEEILPFIRRFLDLGQDVSAILPIV